MKKAPSLLVLAAFAYGPATLAAQGPDSVSRVGAEVLRNLQKASILRCSFDTSYVSTFLKGTWQTTVTKNDPDDVFIISDINLRAAHAIKTWSSGGLSSQLSVRLHPDGLELVDSSWDRKDDLGLPLGSRATWIVYGWQSSEGRQRGLPVVSTENLWSTGNGPLTVTRLGTCKPTL